MKIIHFHLINPLDWFKGMIKFPIGYYKFDTCNCKTCVKVNGEEGGWGIMFLFFGISVSN